jgi:hypothetical protein
MQLPLWWNDMRFAWRNVLTRPGFTVLVVTTLALGIGVNSAVFPHDVLELQPTPADYAAWRDARSFQSVALVATDHFTVTGQGEPERVAGARCTASLFPLLGLSPRLGRAFTADEDKVDAAPVAILSDGLWRRRYGADPAVVGRQVHVDGTPYTVVGIMPPDARLPGPLGGSDEL